RPSTRSSPTANSSRIEIGHCSKDPTQQMEQKSSLVTTEQFKVLGRNRSSTGHVRAWAPELIWAFLSIMVFIALVITLRQYDKRPVPEWRFGLTLNTVVAFLSTICRSMTVVPISEGLSQLKWNWIATRRRPLWDLYTFDQASRGPIGSLLLMVTLRGRHVNPIEHGMKGHANSEVRFITLGWLASLVMVSGLFTSFLTQSTIAYTNARALTTGSSAPVARTYPVVSQDEQGFQDIEALESMSRALIQGGIRMPSEPWPYPELECDTNECEYPEFSSLAMCASVSNISDSLVVSTSISDMYEDTRIAKLANTTATLDLRNSSFAQSNITVPGWEPNVSLLSTTETFWPLRWNFVAGWDNADDLQTATVAQLHILYNNFGGEDLISIRAAEVLWHFCVKTYDARVDNATSFTTERGSTTHIHKRQGDFLGPNGAFFNLSSQSGNGSFQVRFAEGYEKLNGRFRDVFEGPRGFNSIESKSLSFVFGANLYADTDFPDRSDLFSRLSEGEVDRRTWSNLQSTANNIANAMTAYMRNADTDNHIEGKAYKQELHILVRWEWLSLLVIQLTLTLVFLIWVMVLTAQLDMDVVKSSNLAELFAMHGADESTVSADEGESVELLSKGINTKIDKDITARLSKRNYEWKIYLG
ncbi:unnamed protein product, partial [Clonostachys byssicola]